MVTTRKKPASLALILKSLGDPIRLSIVRQLLAAGGMEKSCGSFDFRVTKATFSHHMAILEEAGIIQGRADGRCRMISLRTDALGENFPGLIQLISTSS